MTMFLTGLAVGWLTAVVITGGYILTKRKETP
jgi:hypothetical protein